jgi:hypothetical protein
MLPRYAINTNSRVARLELTVYNLTKALMHATELGGSMYSEAADYEGVV